MVTRRSKIHYYFYTIIYLKKIQLYYRVKFLIKRKLYNIFPLIYNSKYSKISIKNAFNIKDNFVLPSPLIRKLAKIKLENLKDKIDNILKNRLSFLNKELNFGSRINFKNDLLNSMGLLWKFHLHYHEFLNELAVAYTVFEDREIYYEKFKEIVNEWNNFYFIGQDDWQTAWHPYVISLRSVNWIICFKLFSESIEKDKSDFKKTFLTSLYKQVLFLEKNIEYNILGNHLIKNGKALVFAGLFFQNKRWLKKGIKILKKEASEQILDDGGHFELSPMYHLIVAEDYLDIITILKTNNNEAYSKLFLEKSLKMIEFLEDIIHVDNEIPLFNDSAFKHAISPLILFEYAKNIAGFESKKYIEKCISKDKSGYYIIKSPPYHVIVDCGKIGPDYLPGHSHSDTLSFELDFQGERMVVDSGVFEYEEGEIRNYFRSTRAHNTISIDKEEQSEIWKSFRVAKRAYPKNVKLYEEDDKIIFEGSHTGYKRLKGKVEHKRKIIVIKDLLGIIDLITGKKEHLIESFIHFHPDIKDIFIKENKVVIPSKNITIFIWNSPKGNITLEEGEYSPEFGVKIKNYVIKISNKTSLPYEFGYFFIPSYVSEPDWQFIFSKFFKELTLYTVF